VALIRQAVGMPELEVELLGALPWQAVVRVVEGYRQGNVFFAGDAAHVMPPWGGFGANTGIQDAHNLAWKLGAVLAGHASESLLDTYDLERRPVAQAVSAIAGSMSDAQGLMRIDRGPTMLWTMRRVFPYLTMGYGYSSPAIHLEPGRRPGPGFTELRGRPGTRAPHAWLTRDGAQLSSLDLFGRSYVLVAGERGQAWAEAAQSAARALGLPLTAVVLGSGVQDPKGLWSRALGIGPSGASLVRPDGIVAWRSRKAGASSADEFRTILRGLLGQPGAATSQEVPAARLATVG
jgi:putative polyketide hydroxylase